MPDFDKGCFFINRTITEHWIFNHPNPNFFKFWIWCLSKASYKERIVNVKVKRGVDVVKLGRGQFIFGRESASKKLNIPGSTLRNFLVKLEKCEKVTTKADTNYTIITVCNYDEHQTLENYIGQQNGQILDSNRTAIGHKQEGKESKEGKEEKNTMSSKSKAPDISDEVNDTSSARVVNLPYKKIIEYLNKKNGSRFSPTSKTTQKHIRARFNEGFCLEDFFVVIDKKYEDWHNRPEMVQWLRPQTLFGNNFEGYLNACWRNGNGSSPQQKHKYAPYDKKTTEEILNLVDKVKEDNRIPVVKDGVPIKGHQQKISYLLEVLEWKSGK